MITLAILATLLASAMLWLLWSLPWPVSDPARLAAIRGDAQVLRARYPAKPPEHYTRIPENEWPGAIAGIHPDRVIVHEWGVDIVVKPFFDGGWGYHVAPDKRQLPKPQGCYSEVSREVFWHGPLLSGASASIRSGRLGIQRLPRLAM